MDQPKKFNTKQRSEESQELSVQSQTENQSQREFPSVEELLRHDARETPVPQTIAQRLQESINQNPAPSRSWWRRLLGG